MNEPHESANSMTEPEISEELAEEKTTVLAPGFAEAYKAHSTGRAEVPASNIDEQTTRIVPGNNSIEVEQATTIIPPPVTDNTDYEDTEQQTRLVRPQEPMGDQATTVLPTMDQVAGQTYGTEQGGYQPYVPANLRPGEPVAAPLQTSYSEQPAPTTGWPQPDQTYGANQQAQQSTPTQSAWPASMPITNSSSAQTSYATSQYSAYQPPTAHESAWYSPAGSPAQPPAGAIEISVPMPGQVAPTAEEFAKRREHKPIEPEPTMGLPALMRKVSFGLFAPAMSQKEKDYREAVAKVRRNFGGLRQVTVVNPKGGAGKTVAVLMTAMTFGQSRGGYVLAWDNNETQGTLGMRAQPDFHAHTVRDVLHSLEQFQGPSGKIGDLTQFVRSQGEAMFDVLASDESATAGEMLTADAFKAIREIVDRFYKLMIVDTGNNVRAENWQAAIDATDQLIVTMSARGDSAETAARMLDHLEQTGRAELARNAVTVVSMPATRKGLDLPAIKRHFSARTRGVWVAPYERLLDSGEPIRYEGISKHSQEAWLKIAAAVAEGL